MIVINGLMGEGGGQILRSSLALSMALGIPFRMVNIRANRPKPGLRAQHLACVRAAQEICSASVTGAELDSRDVTFVPGVVRAGEYSFDIGTVGSVTLLLQAILPPLLLASGPSKITVTGGTHVPFAPPFEFMADCLFPRLEDMGPKLTAQLSKVGYMESGGGQITVHVGPVGQLRPLQIEHQNALSNVQAIIYAHEQPESVARRENDVLLSDKFRALDLDDASIIGKDVAASGSGNAVLVVTEHGDGKRMVFGEYLQRNRPPAKFADIAARHALDYIRSGCAFDYHLADQLLVPLALAGGGSFTLSKVTGHVATCLETINCFVDCKHDLQPIGTKSSLVSFSATPRTEGASAPSVEVEVYRPRETPAPWRQWGTDLVEDDAVEQMGTACSLPKAVCGALIPDAHRGYGLPIGGVLAVKNAVIPYAVGVDIACRMRLTVLDMPVSMFERENRNILRQALKQETRFGIGAMFTAQERRDHAVMAEDWSFSEIVRQHKTKAWKQLGTSGKGNHFVEFGVLQLQNSASLGGKELAAGSYLALLSHSGSRGTGEAVATYYSNVAMQKHPCLPFDIRHLAWLDLDSDAGEEYWAAIQLMGRYASANHELIHQHILRNLGAEALTHVENHHNFAWKEVVNGEEVIVHRKGATPAGLGVEGIIPGSMASPAFIVRGKGNAEALNSCSHGAGRLMSRTVALQRLDPAEVVAALREKDVEVISGQLDEAPAAYKDIHEIVAAQSDLVDLIGSFMPRMVRMAPVEGRKDKQKAYSISSSW